jgi:Glycosyltransferase like family 2
MFYFSTDDRLLPEAVATGVRLLEERPECALAVGEHRYIAADGTELRQSNKHPARGDHYLMLLESNFIEAPCSALHRRSSLSMTGVFDENLRVGEDWQLYLRTARHCAMISHNAIVSEYRQHDSNASRNAELMLSGCRHVLQMELPYIEGDRAKLRLQQNCLRFVDRRFGRHLARELIHDRRLKTPENRRKLKVLRRHYSVGFVAVVLSRLLPAHIVNALFARRSHLPGMRTGA